MVEKNLTIERALEIVKNVTEREGAFAQEVAVLSICIGIIEPLPEMMRARVVKHLYDIFQGIDNLAILTSLALGARELKSEVRALTIERDQLRNDLNAAAARLARAEGIAS